MSLINDMLRNLEQRHAADAPLPNEVRPLPAESPGVPWKPLAAVLAITVIGGAAILLALRDVTPPAVTAPPQPAVAAKPPPVSVPAATGVAPPAPTAAMPAPPETATAATTAPPAAAPEKPRAMPAEKPPAVAAKRRQEPVPATDTLRLATSLPSQEQVKPKQGEPMPPAAAPLAEKPAGSDPAAQAEGDLRRARELLAQGRRAEAEPFFRQALARSPGQTDAAMTLARLEVDRSDLAGAWETLQQSLPHARQHAGYRAFCGTVLQRLNRPREAVEHYQAALRLNPAEGRWWVGLGLALESAGQPAEAREAFQRARTADNLPPEMAAFAEQKAR